MSSSVLFLCLLLGATAAEEPPSPEDPQLRVLTYNIHHGEGTDAVFDLDRIVSVIQSANPDIVCLQEVDRGLSRTQRLDLPTLLADKLGMGVQFGGNYHFDNGDYGNATLTRLEILETENTPLPRFEQREPRGVLRTSIRWNGAVYQVLNTHLGLVPEERKQQAAFLLEMFEQYAEPIILCGDLNEVPAGVPLEMLLSELRDSGEGLEIQPTVPSGAPRRRIDYILHRGPLHISQGRTMATEETAVASDHLPYLAVFTTGEADSSVDAPGKDPAE